MDGRGFVSRGFWLGVIAIAASGVVMPGHAQDPIEREKKEKRDVIVRPDDDKDYERIEGSEGGKRDEQEPVPIRDERDKPLVVAMAIDKEKGSRAMTAAVSRAKGVGLSGLFLTEPGTGWIVYRPSRTEEPDTISFDQFERMYEFEKPAGIVFADPRLYVYDAATRTVSSLLTVGEATKQQVELISRLEGEPSHIAVSPHGLVAVIENGEVVVLQKDHEPSRYSGNRFPDPIDLAFSSWDTLEILDASRNTLVSITLRRMPNGDVHFENERSLPAPEEGGEHRWRGMSIFDGVVYLVDHDAVYAYLASDRRLVPVALRSGEWPGLIYRAAITYESLYLLHSDHIRRYPRAEPVDLALNGGPVESQRALLAFYAYLHRNRLLLTRSVRARGQNERLDKLLFDNGVLLVPQSERPDRVVRALTKGRKPEPGSAEEKAFMQVFCSMNPEAGCNRSPSLKMIVPQGAKLEVPRVELLRRLSKETVELDGLTMSEHVAWRVPSESLRGQADAVVRKLNPRWTEADLTRTKGTAVVPVEQWTVIAAVPAPDYRNRTSELWTLARQYDGAYIYDREGFTAQSVKRMALSPPLFDVATDCQTLKQGTRSLLKAIKYPVEFRARPASPGGPPTDPGEEEAVIVYPPLKTEAPRVGVLEFASTVGTRHQVFCSERTAPSWHQVVNFDLVAEPNPSSYSDTSQDLTGASTFSLERHGTHVAGIIGGRQTACWSGLLPRARLVLVDLTDAGSVQRSIAAAIDADVRVFNVSQAFETGQQTLEATIKQAREQALFVAAAGPGEGGTGALLNNTEPENVPAPARWGQWANVITVTGTNAAGVPLPQLNRGKRYVDLAAVGEQVYSASEAPGAYGPATGSSQAAPQVAAAAAMLVDPNEAALSPGDAKARLIASADWDNGLQQDLWGGRLNFASAVRFPDRHVLVTTTGSDLGLVHSIVPRGDPTIHLRNSATYFEREEAGAIAPDKIKFARILSLRKLPSGRFRIVLRDQQDRLKIVMDADLSSSPGSDDNKIECSAETLNRETGDFETDTRVCAERLEISQIEEYVRGGAYRIRWPKP